MNQTFFGYVNGELVIHEFSYPDEEGLKESLEQFCEKNNLSVQRLVNVKEIEDDTRYPRIPMSMANGIYIAIGYVALNSVLVTLEKLKVDWTEERLLSEKVKDAIKKHFNNVRMYDIGIEVKDDGEISITVSKKEEKHEHLEGDLRRV